MAPEISRRDAVFSSRGWRVGIGWSEEKGGVAVGLVPGMPWIESVDVMGRFRFSEGS